MPVRLKLKVLVIVDYCYFSDFAELVIIWNGISPMLNFIPEILDRSWETLS